MSPRRRKLVTPQRDYDRLNEDSARDGGALAENGVQPGLLTDKSKIQLEVAAYVESMSAELRTMARDVDLESLAYFLEMVRIEASSHIERGAQMS